ncbi:MAG: alpha/beta hydrolase [Devosia sp.]|nr:alpha/beta hydrolase [Devosia sp.]
MIEIDPFDIPNLVPDFEAVKAGNLAASAESRTRLRARFDVAYGSGARHRLDLFFPENATGPLPVHMFIHGGYWYLNDKEMFAFPAETIVASGAIAAIVEYTLIPNARMAQLVEEVRQAARWLIGNAAGFGGDPQAFSASGHSAGGHLASYLAARAPHEQAGPGIDVKALLLVSGLYDLRPIAMSFLQPSLDLTEEEVAQYSPVGAEQQAGPKVRVTVGHDETEPFHRQAQDLCNAAERHGQHYERITLPELDHMTIVRDMGRPGTQMGGLLRETIAASGG